MAELRIGISGCAGRMGRMLVAEVAATKGCVLAGGVDAPTSRDLGKDIGELAGIGAVGLKAGSDVAALLAASDVMIEFAIPEASVAHAALAAAVKKPLVIGTTGLDAKAHDALVAAAKTAPILWAPNMSLGVNWLLALVEQTARRLGEDYDIEILEMHHRHKVDAPSGTALALGKAAAQGRGIDLAARSQRSRDGITGARKAGDIGFATLRGGDNAGEHRVIFAAEGEQLELGHRATSRRVFAHGAVAAAQWLAKQPPGLYAMKDVLGI
ncbi:MAG TPA: 4-hydroxy-tetrahydrodipicolinate reductase [Stellaceae bacterium]|nr:4-hydroxy-tetrahydrodipicolinate reductase [Stellaceae bacterium]